MEQILVTLENIIYTKRAEVRKTFGRNSEVEENGVRVFFFFKKAEKF